MRRTMLLGAVVSLALPLVMAPSAGATTERAAISGQDLQITVLDPGVVWISEDGVQHVRGWIGSYQTTDSLYGVGSLVIVGNWNLKLTTGNGSLWGTMYYEFPAAGGGFEGTWNAKFSAFLWSGKSQGTGFGDLRGWHLRQDLQSTGPTSDVYTGFVFNTGR